jgi:uncharacterized membrane protein (DUF485 family)
MKLTEQLKTILATPVVLLQETLPQRGLTQVERNFIALHVLCESTEIDIEIQDEKRAIIFNGGLDALLGGLLTLLSKDKRDRQAVFVVCAFLCLMELYVSFVLFTIDPPPQWLANPVVLWISFGAVFLAYIIPLIAYGISELIMWMVRGAVKRWIEEEKTRQAQAAAGAQIAELPPNAA